MLRGLGGDEMVQKSSFSKNCHTYPTRIQLNTVKPYLKNIQKIYSRDIFLEFCRYQNFFTRNQQILLYQEIPIQIAF